MTPPTLLSLTPAEFEVTCADLLAAMAYTDVRVVGGAGDLNADILATDPAGRSVIVQCKRYAPRRSVRSGEMQSFIGMQVRHHRTQSGVYMTTSTFTRDAAALARHHRITLLDGAELARLASDLGIGTPPVPQHALRWVSLTVVVACVAAAGSLIATGAIHVPVFPVGQTQDQTCVLAASGHNARVSVTGPDADAICSQTLARPPFSGWVLDTQSQRCPDLAGLSPNLTAWGDLRRDRLRLCWCA